MDFVNLLNLYISKCKLIFDSKSYTRLLAKGYFYDNTNLKETLKELFGDKKLN